MVRQNSDNAKLHRGIVDRKTRGLYEAIGKALGLTGRELEEYWPGQYEMRLMNTLDYVAACEDVPIPHSSSKSPRGEHDYAVPLPLEKEQEYLRHMHQAHEAFMQDYERERNLEFASEADRADGRGVDPGGPQDWATDRSVDIGR